MFKLLQMYSTNMFCMTEKTDDYMHNYAAWGAHGLSHDLKALIQLTQILLQNTIFIIIICTYTYISLCGICVCFTLHWIINSTVLHCLLVCVSWLT